MDLGGKHTGTVAGGMNTGGAGGGMVAAPMVAYLLKFSNDNWNVPLYVAAAGLLRGDALLAGHRSGDPDRGARPDPAAV